MVGELDNYVAAKRLHLITSTAQRMQLTRIIKVCALEAAAKVANLFKPKVDVPVSYIVSVSMHMFRV